jgi:ubiquinone/menaquinone biosynthesis C-methylase UbiE
MHSKPSDFDSRIHYGNLEANLHFLNKTGVLSKQKKLLEIGSGTGGMLAFLYKEGYDIEGIEINDILIERSKTIYGGLPLSLTNSEILPFEDNSFDVVMSFDVFEHIPNSDKHLSEVFRVLKQNGHYLLQTPNKFTNVVFETIRWKSFTKWKKGHCSLHSYWGIIDRFGKNGFDVRFYCIPVVNDFFKQKVNRYLGSSGLFLLGIINPDKFPTAFRPNFYVKAKKKR